MTNKTPDDERELHEISMAEIAGLILDIGFRYYAIAFAAGLLAGLAVGVMV